MRKILYLIERSLKDICDRVFNTVCKIKDEIQDEVDAALLRDPAAKSRIYVLMFYPGVKAVLMYRAAHGMYVKGHIAIAHSISYAARRMTGIEIHPAAMIGKSFFIDHGMGTVIGETARIGDRCTIYQGVTLGGTGKERGIRHPKLGNDVTVGSGAKILGNISVGDECKIGANAVLLESLPPFSTAVGIPARALKTHDRPEDTVRYAQEISLLADEVSEYIKTITTKENIL